MPFYLFAWIGSIGSGLAVTSTKLTSKHSISNPWLFNFVFMFFVMLFMIPLALFNHVTLPNFWLPIIVGGFAQASFFALYMLSIYRLDVSTITPLFNFRVLFVILFGILVFGERLSSFQILLAAVVIIFGVLATLDERMSIKCFLNPSIAIALLSMIMLAVSNLCVRWAGNTSSNWTITLWMIIFTFLFNILTYPMFKKDIGKIKKRQLAPIIFIGLIQVVTSFAITTAFSKNAAISAIIISLPLSMVFALLFSIFAPKLLEKHTLKIYLIRFISTGVMIYCAFLLSR